MPHDTIIGEPTTSVSVNCRAGMFRGVRLFVPWIAMIGPIFSQVGIVIAVEKKPEVPPGYEDALVADEEAADVPTQDGVAPPMEEEEENDPEQDDKLDANLLNLERQFLRQFQRIFNAERSFIPRACELTSRQRLELAKATEEIPKTVAKRYALWQHKMKQGRVRAGRSRSSTALDPRTLVLDALQRAARKCLSPTQAEQYESELAKRVEHRKRTTVLNLVAKLDQDLVLTSEQRAKLTELLTANWKVAWAQSYPMFRHNNPFLPHIPDQQIVPILNPAQRTVWRGAQKHSTRYSGGIGFGNPIVTVDDFEVGIDATNGGDPNTRIKK